MPDTPIKTSPGGRAYSVDNEELSQTLNVVFMTLEYTRQINNDPVIT